MPTFAEVRATALCTVVATDQRCVLLDYGTTLFVFSVFFFLHFLSVFD